MAAARRRGFEAVTVNALLAGLEVKVVLSAASKVTVSTSPPTEALTTRDGSTVTVTVSAVAGGLPSPSRLSART